MTADTPTSVATINHLLLGAPYTSPLVIPGDWLVDELEGAVEVGGFTDGLFRWPTRSAAAALRRSSAATCCARYVPNAPSRCSSGGVSVRAWWDAGAAPSA